MEKHMKENEIFLYLDNESIFSPKQHSVGFLSPFIKTLAKCHKQNHRIYNSLEKFTKVKFEWKKYVYFMQVHMNFNWNGIIHVKFTWE